MPLHGLSQTNDGYTVRINEIHPWLNKVCMDTSFRLVISRQNQISFTLPQTRNSVIHKKIDYESNKILY